MATKNFNRVKASELELQEKVVSINRVVKTTKGVPTAAGLISTFAAPSLHWW